MSTNVLKGEAFSSPEAKVLLQLLLTGPKVVLTTHEGPDGDGIGSEIALFRALKRRGIRASIINPGPAGKRFAFLDSSRDIEVFRPALEGAVLEADVVVLVDTGEIRRTGPMAEVLKRRKGPVMAIDHHPVNGNSISGILCPDFSSTGELIAALFDHLGVEITKDLAHPLYCAILYDTNQFRFVRNNPSVFWTAARLVEAGADAEAASKHLFGTVSRDHLLLLGRVMETATFECGGRLAWCRINRDTLHGLSVDSDDVRTMVMHLSEVEGVQIAVVFKQFDEKGKVKVSIRSPGNIVISDVAEALGGGGHLFAAGADLDCPLDEAVSRVLPLLRAKFGCP